MDYTGFATPQEFPIDGTNPFSPPVSSVTTTTTDHVKWQGSQTACQALNQLIQSSANEDGVGTSRGWQRQPSFDQIPGFSLLSTNETGSSSGLAWQANASNSTKPLSRSSRSSMSRARPSDTRTRPVDQTNVDASHSGLPFFDKTNPSQFLDMLKGVSARLDENVGAHKKDVVGQASRAEKVKKRSRGASLGVPSEHLVGNTKSRRMDGSRVARQHSVLDKGKARAVSASVLTWDMQPTGSDASSYLDRVSTLDCGHDDSFMDVDDGPRSIAPPSFDPPPATLSRPSSSISFPKTPSQAEMPPPALPTKHPSVAHTTPQSSVNHRRHPPSVDVKPRKPDPIPKLHPLLQQQAAQSKSSISASPVLSNPASFNDHVLAQSAVEQRPPPKVDARPQVHAAAPATTNPMPPALTPSNRPPVLGMRRTHTYPSRSGAPRVSNQFFGNNSNNAPLPTRQKGFKPPLLSNSQPQPQLQGRITVNSRPQPQYPARKGNVDVKVEASSSTSRSFPASSNSSGSQNSAKSGTSSASHSRSGSGSGCNTSVDSMPSSIPVDVPASDTDPDSSFGDMSFDMDALEETMKMYD